MEGVEFRQYLIRITIINWLVSLFRTSPELCTYEGLMDELAEWLWSDICTLEGCDNLLLGYPATALFCCDAHRDRSRNKTPGRKAYPQNVIARFGVG